MTSGASTAGCRPNRVTSIHRAATLASACMSSVKVAAAPQLRLPDWATSQTASRPAGIKWPLYGVNS